MIMIRFILLFFTSAALLSNVSNAQTAPKQCSVGIPEILDKGTIFLQDVQKLPNSNYGQNNKRNKFWDAYSDRCNNKLYSSPNTSSPTGKSLKFNQKVRIANIQNGFAQVYTEKKPSAVNYPNVSDDIVYLGWVPMENLLLWNSCPTNEFGIYRKALIVQNIDERSDESFGYISEHPDPKDASNRSELRSSIDFHYIMKTIGTGDNTRYLLARFSQLDGYTDKVLEGWVSKNSFTPWNQRSCLEPNWEKDAVEYYKNSGITAHLYEDKELKKPTQEWQYGQKNQENQPTTQYRMPPYTMRFPILDNDAPDKKNTFKLTAFGTPDGKLGAMSVTMSKANKEREEALKKTAQINVIVVIDGTRSMGQYFGTMAKAIKEANQYLAINGNEKVKVGAVIYRDYADGENNVIEYHKMVDPAESSIGNFLTNVGRNNYGATSSNADKTAWEAMYLGLKTALDYEKMGYSPQNSNLIFVIGDCGNDPRDNNVSQDELLRMCKASNAQLFSFQVLNQDKQAYNDFNDQLTDIFSNHIKYLYTDKVEAKWGPAKKGVKVKTNSEENYYVSEIHRGQANEQLPESDLSDLIKSSFTSFRSAIDKQMTDLTNAGRSGKTIEGGNHKAGQVSINHEFLKRKLGVNYEAVLAANSLLAYTGYTQKSNGDGRDYWQAVVILSSEELKALVHRLEPVKVAAKSTTYSDSDRKAYVDALAGVIQAMTEKDAEEIANMSTDEVTRVIGGLNASTPITQGKFNGKTYTLAEIKNRNACPDEDFKKILKSMSTKIEDLSNLSRNKSFKYVFEQNGKKSYWLPLEMIP